MSNQEQKPVKPVEKPKPKPIAIRIETFDDKSTIEKKGN
jgi:hypothetical protein